MKDIIVELLKFIKESSVTKILLALLLPGIAAIAIALSDVLSAKFGLSLGARYVAFLFGIICFAVALGQFLIQLSLSRLKTWMKLQFVSTAMADIHEQIEKIVAKATKDLDDHNKFLLDQATDTFTLERVQLQKIQTELVNKVEDATRRVLEGIPKIFDRAYRLIKQADKEIWLVNFVLEFGKAHCENETVRNRYQEEFARDYEDDVRDFYDTLQTKAKQVPIVNILTLSSNNSYEKFVEPLLARPGYESLSETVIDRQKIRDVFNDERPRPKYEFMLKGMEAAKKKFVEDIPTERKERKFKAAHQYRCYEMSSLPIQLVIAGISGKDGQPSNKYGCVVFMLGSDMIRTTESGKEVGIYTELDDLVAVMKNLAWTLMRPEGLLVSEPINVAQDSAKTFEAPQNEPPNADTQLPGASPLGD